MVPVHLDDLYSFRYIMASIYKYEPSAQRLSIGSFQDDVIDFGSGGLRQDNTVIQDFAILQGQVRSDYSQDDASIARVLKSERVAFTLREGDEEYDLHVRTLGSASIAFLCDVDGPEIETMLLAMEGNPPFGGEHDWWRTTLEPRMKDALGISP